MKRTVWTSVLVVALPLAFGTPNLAQSPARETGAAPGKPPVVLTHDPELDDVNTVIRALLYSTDFRLEGLVYGSASIHFKGNGKGTTQFPAHAQTGQTIHVILEATDNGTPSLTRYQRVVVTIGS